MGDDEGAKREERRKHVEDLPVATGREIRLDEAREQLIERRGDDRSVFRRPSAQPEEEIVDGEGRHVVGGLTPLAAAAVKDGEVRAFPEEQIPGMEITVNAREAGLRADSGRP